MSFQEKFKAILATNDFDSLTPFKEPLSWHTMDSDERELLGILFIKMAEQQLKRGEEEVSESFELASQVAPQSAVVFFRKALAYAAQGQNIRCLISASQALEKAIEIDPTFISAWHSWGNILVRIGLFYENPEYFHQADEKFKMTDDLIKSGESRHSENLHWHWGVCWYHLGKHSGEAVDFFQALEKFRTALQNGCNGGDFHNDFGNVLIDLACLLGRQELLVEAAEHYKKFIASSSHQYEGWLNLACTYQRLHEFTGLSGYFREANTCFEKTLELAPEDAIAWLRWAELYSTSGKINRDIELIQASLEKFITANAFESDNPHVLLRWGEAQMLMGAYSENLDLLRDAERKILTALDSLAESPEAWYVYGVCLNEFGRYFASENFYGKAIEKFYRGLSINGSHPLLLHGMALTYFALGELKEELTMIEESVRFFNRASERGTHIPPQFFSDWGVALMKLGEMTSEKAYIELAAEKFEQAIARRVDGSSRDALELEWLYNYGCALDFLGDFHEEPTYYEKAIQVLSHVLKIDPEYTNARYNLALALSHLGELNADADYFHKAIDLLQDVVQEDPEDEIAWNDYGLAFLNLAVLVHDPAHPSDGQLFFGQAENKLLQSIALGNVQAFYNLACLYALSGNFSAAMHYLERGEHSNALPPVDDVIHDEWLETLHDMPAFRHFISRLLHKEEESDSE